MSNFAISTTGDASISRLLRQRLPAGAMPFRTPCEAPRNPPEKPLYGQRPRDPRPHLYRTRHGRRSPLVCAVQHFASRRCRLFWIPKDRGAGFRGYLDKRVRKTTFLYKPFPVCKPCRIPASRSTGCVASGPKTTRLAVYAPACGERRSPSYLPQSSSAVGNRGFWPSCVCSAGKSASSNSPESGNAASYPQEYIETTSSIQLAPATVYRRASSPTQSMCLQKNPANWRFM